MKTLIIKVWRLSFFANFAVTLVFFYPIFKILFLKPRYYSAALKLQRFWAAWLLFWSGIHVIPIFEEPITGKGPFVWCPNHTSALDILELYGVIPHYFHFVAKKEHAQTPLFGVMFTKTHIPIRRDSMTDSYKAMQRAMADLKKGIDIVLFPEGTMNFEKNKILPFKSGAFKLACDADVPILPVFMPDNLDRIPFTYTVLYPGGSPGKARVIIGKPIYPKEFEYDSEVIEEQVRSFMEKQMLKHGIHNE